PHNAPQNEYTPSFARFPALVLLHLHIHVKRRPQRNLLSEDFTVQTDAWVSSARIIALALLPLDFVG
ncbi:hypothetical protein B0H21DRAFT_662950, partial [Amylocystis lapponica]